METEENKNLGSDINPETGDFIETEKVSSLEKLIRAQKIGVYFYAPGTLVQDSSSGEFGIVESVKKINDPTYNMKKPTLTEMKINYDSGTRIVTGGAIPVYGFNDPNQRERLNKPPLEITPEHQCRFSISEGENSFKLGDIVTVDGQLAKLAVIYPDIRKAGLVFSIMRKSKKYERMYQVATDKMRPITRRIDGTIEGQPRPYFIEKNVDGHWIIE